MTLVTILQLIYNLYKEEIVLKIFNGGKTLNLDGMNDEEIQKMYNQLFDRKYIKKKLLIFSAFIMFYENFEDTIIENVRTIYISGIPSRKGQEEQMYQNEILRGDDKSKTLTGSLKKLIEYQFISEEDLKELKKHAQIRNKVVHEMTECFFGDYYLEVGEALKSLLLIMRKYNKNWIQNFEIPCGLLIDYTDKEIEKIDIENITTVNIQFLELLNKLIVSIIDEE